MSVPQTRSRATRPNHRKEPNCERMDHRKADDVRLARTAAVTVVAAAAVYAAVTVAAYAAFIRWAAETDDDLATIHPIHPTERETS